MTRPRDLETVPITKEPLLSLADVRLEAGGNTLVHGVDITVASGEVTALVGESGSGKTLLARSTLGLLPAGVHCTSGSMRFCGGHYDLRDSTVLKGLRGRDIGLVFQEPTSALNPTLRMGVQLRESLQRRGLQDAGSAEAAMIEVLESLSVPDPGDALRKYPHQFSGGLRQRLMLAAVLLHEPRLILADEPTTALDATVQREVMDLFVSVARERGAAILLITHDLGVVADYARELFVMADGRVVDSGRTDAIFAAPQQRVTRRLLEALPQLAHRASCSVNGSALVTVDHAQVSFPLARCRLFGPKPRFRALRDVSLSVRQGECLALVGESGSGKSTLGRAMLGLQALDSGRVHLDGLDLGNMTERVLRPLRPRYQLVFQDPYAALDPRQRVADLIAEGLASALRRDRAAREERIATLMAEVELDPALRDRFPHALSGGQRQRVCIARALACEPRLLVADEPVAALDLTVQQQVIRLLARIQRERGLTLLFISHDLAVVASLADRVAVLCKGQLLEEAPVDALLARPHHPYTRCLLASAAFLDRDGESGQYLLRHRKADPVEPPAGYRYFDAGSDALRAYQEVAPGHRVAMTIVQARENS